MYGRSGSGKTTIAATFPAPLLLMDIGEKGTDSVMTTKGLDVLRVLEWDDTTDIYWDIADGRLKYKTVIIDAVHTWQDLAIEEAKDQNGKGEDDATSKRDFGVASGLMKQWIQNWRDLTELGINVVFLAHDRVTEGEEEEEFGMLTPEVGPRVMPSVASVLTGGVNVVGNTFIREQIKKAKVAGKKSEKIIHYCLRLGPHAYYATKVRNPKEFIVPDFIEDPTHKKIVDVIKGKGTTPKTKPKTKILRHKK